jgi:hypothetical protein
VSDVAARNPYAPPTADVAETATATGLKHRSVVVVFLLAIVTFGLYYPVWFFRRRSGLNRLDSSRKLALWPLVTFAVFLAFQFVLAVAAGDSTPEEKWGSGVAVLLMLWQLGVSILMVVQCFVIKGIIEDHAQEAGGDAERGLFKPPVKLSGLMTFFFSILYLQYAINKYAVASRS